MRGVRAFKVMLDLPVIKKAAQFAGTHAKRRMPFTGFDHERDCQQYASWDQASLGDFI
jgi:hypothetical protein